MCRVSRRRSRSPGRLGRRLSKAFQLWKLPQLPETEDCPLRVHICTEDVLEGRKGTATSRQPVWGWGTGAPTLQPSARLLPWVTELTPPHEA